jgi:predicted Zn-dependent protease
LLSVKTPSDSESTLSVSEAALLAQANTLYAAKKPMEAAATLEGALHRVRTPTAQGFAATASTFYLQANDPQKAVAVASRCVNLSAKNTSKLSACYQALAKAYDATGETEKSQSARDKAARLDKKRIGL